MERKQSLFCRLVVALTCSIGCVSSSVVAQQKLNVAEKRDETIADFARRVFAFVEANPVDRFVLDIRQNNGGNSLLYQPFIHGLIRSDKVNQTGKLFVLVAERPRSDEALFLLGDGYERSGDVKQAIENYEKSLALNPKNWEIVDRINALREKQGRGGQ